jgi:hypothetical protein
MHAPHSTGSEMHSFVLFGDHASHGEAFRFSSLVLRRIPHNADGTRDATYQRITY